MNNYKNPIYQVYSSLKSYFLRKKLRRTMRVHIDQGVKGIHNVVFRGNNSIGRYSVFSSKVEIGVGSTIGAFSVITGPVRIGPYCQFGQFTGIFGEDHPISFLTTYVNQNLFDGRLRENLQQAPVQIGAGVWIGQGCVVLKGVRIGDGAIIGASTVVTKDIPAYSIAVGNPAKIVRMRFSPEILELVSKIDWWNIPLSKLAEIESIFKLDFGINPCEGVDELRKILDKVNLIE